jgi:hypothetical protein
MFQGFIGFCALILCFFFIDHFVVNPFLARIRGIETRLDRLLAMQEGLVREVREARQMQDASDKEAQRALAAVLEVSVEFADAQRRLEQIESVLSMNGADLAAMPPEEAVTRLAARRNLTEEVARRLLRGRSSPK